MIQKRSRTNTAEFKHNRVVWAPLFVISRIFWARIFTRYVRQRKWQQMGFAFLATSLCCSRWTETERTKDFQNKPLSQWLISHFRRQLGFSVLIYWVLLRRSSSPLRIFIVLSNHNSIEYFAYFAGGNLYILIPLKMIEHIPFIGDWHRSTKCKFIQKKNIKKKHHP